MTDVNIWNISMTTQDMVSWTNCNNNQNGNIVIWDVKRWILTGLEKLEINVSSLCEINLVIRKIFPNKRNYQNSVNLCKGLGGRITKAHNVIEVEEMIRISNEHDFNGIWTPYNDIKQEGKFVDTITEEEMKWANWAKGMPNGGKVENCIALNADGTMNDVTCHGTKHTFCDLQRPKLNLRGACLRENLDVNYVMQLDKINSSTYEIIGLKYSKLVRLEDKWAFINSTKHMVAFTNDTIDYPLGTHRWYFTSQRCKEVVDKWRWMNLNSCKEQEFPCRNGECVDMSFRCDKNYNCDDFSDEENCAFKTVDGYDEMVPPKKLIKDGVDKKTDINISIHIYNFLQFNEIDSRFTVEFTMSRTWTDSRITFISLNEDTYKNIIDGRNESIWTPSIEFMDIVIPKINHLQENNIVVATLKQEEGVFNIHEELLKNKLYFGANNIIVQNSSFIGSFVCSFPNILVYPFDTEICYLKIKMPSNSYHFTKLLPVKLEFSGSRGVGEYVILSIEDMKTIKFHTGHTGIQIQINLGREIGSILLSTYLPTILMNLINQATNYFEGEDLFGDIISINLTCIMVLSALYISVSGTLPPTPSIKYIEIWLLFNLIYPFLIILAQTCLHLAKKQTKKRNNVPHMQMRSKLPILRVEKGWKFKVKITNFLKSNRIVI